VTAKRTEYAIARELLCLEYEAVGVLQNPEFPPPRPNVTDEERDWMNALCEQIAVEQDCERLTNLIHELNDLLEGKQRRLEMEDAQKKPF
jgi:hypothetical protein